MAGLFTKNGYSLGFDGIAPFTGTISNSDEIRERICGVRGAGDTGQTGIGKGTTKIFSIRAIGQFNRNFALNTIARTQLGNGAHLEKMLKIVPAIGQGNVRAVFTTQIAVSIRKCKTDFDGIQRNTSTAALGNRSVTQPQVFDHGFCRKFWRVGASTGQQHNQKAKEEISRLFHHNY
jgi:hypothetical protein